MQVIQCFPEPVFGGCVKAVSQSAVMQRVAFSAASTLSGCHSCNTCLTQQGVEPNVPLVWHRHGRGSQVIVKGGKIRGHLEHG